MVFLEALRLSNSELGSDNDAVESSVFENERELVSNCEFASSKPLILALKLRPRNIAGSTSCTATPKESKVKMACVSFSGIGMLSDTTSSDSRRL